MIKPLQKTRTIHIIEDKKELINDKKSKSYI